MACSTIIIIFATLLPDFVASLGTSTLEAKSGRALAPSALPCVSTDAVHMEESIRSKFFRLLRKGFSSNVEP